jgi:predicted DNA-binding protein with PD1-like motif
MEICDAHDYVFVRLEPGEAVIAALRDVARKRGVRVGIITSGVGMLSAVEFGFFCTVKDDYNIRKLDGILDISSIEGNITWSGEEPVPHVHMTMNDQEQRTYSGHIIEAWCHITMEIFIRKVTTLELQRTKIAGVPATRITGVSGVS